MALACYESQFQNFRLQFCVPPPRCPIFLLPPTTRASSQFQFVRPALVRGALGITKTPSRGISRAILQITTFPPVFTTNLTPPPAALTSPLLPSLSSDAPSPSDEIQRRAVATMPPGRKARGTNREPIEELTDIEKERARTIMRNNQVFQSLGITKLAQIVNSSTTANNKRRAREESDPLYEPENMEETDAELDEAMQRSVLAKNTIKNTVGRCSKRVSMAPVGQDQTARMTRQRTKELSVEERSTTNAQEDALLAINCPTQDEQFQTGFEGEPSDALFNQRSRGKSMGKDLDRICRGLNSRMPLVIAKGKRRPDAPMQAAKLASEGGIILRQHIPIYTHWKEYKKEYEKYIQWKESQEHEDDEDDESENTFKDYMGKMGIKFTIHPDDKEVEAACLDLLKIGQRQLRHKLKKAYFDGVPANEVRTTSPVRSITDEQWLALVQLWSSPKHKERCLKNIENRGKVRFAQKTGSRCFIAHAHVLKKNKYKDVEPTEIDLFKDFHCSSKTGFDEPMKEVLGKMDNMMAQPTPEGGQAKTPAEVFAHVLPSSKFLQNVGLGTVPKRSAAAAARVQELELEVAAKKQGAVALRDQLHDQQDELEALKKMVQESEEAREKQTEEIGNLKKQADDTTALLRRLFSSNKD